MAGRKGPGAAAAGLGGKAPLSEARDGRVWRRPENGEQRRAGHRTKCGARSGSPFFWLLFFGEAKKSDSAAEGRRNRAKDSHSCGHDSAKPNSRTRSRWIPASAGMKTTPARQRGRHSPERPSRHRQPCAQHRKKEGARLASGAPSLPRTKKGVSLSRPGGPGSPVPRGGSVAGLPHRYWSRRGSPGPCPAR
jgi:hypothetical protein